jgi:hypothetical protein
MKNVKTYIGTFAAGAAIAAASLLTVSAPASAATQDGVQAATARTAPQRQEPGQRPDGVQQRRQPAQRSVAVPKRQSSPAAAEEQREQQLQRERAQKQAEQEPQQQSGQSTDPGGFLPDPPVVTPEG